MPRKWAERALLTLLMLVADLRSASSAWPGESFAPPAAWREWWDVTAACAGVPVSRFDSTIPATHLQHIARRRFATWRTLRRKDVADTTDDSSGPRP